MTDTAADPVVSMPEPGYKTSEAWLTFLISLPALILNSGLVADAPLAAKLVSLLAAALATLGYTTNRTSLKRAHLALSVGDPAKLATNTNRLPVAATGAAGAVLAVLVAFGCTSAQKAAVNAGVDVFLQCEKVNLSQLVSSTGVSLLKTVSDDLAQANYSQAIADLITALGPEAVGCAVLAVNTVTETGKVPSAATSIELRARELIATYKWKASPVKAPPPTSTLPDPASK